MIDLGRLTARRGGAVCLLLLGTIYLVARRNADGGFPAAQADSGIELEGPHPRSDLPGWDERHEDYVALAEAARKQKVSWWQREAQRAQLPRPAHAGRASAWGGGGGTDPEGKSPQRNSRVQLTINLTLCRVMRW